MVFASLLLTMTTCLSCGCNDVARSINFTALEEKLLPQLIHLMLFTI